MIRFQFKTIAPLSYIDFYDQTRGTVVGGVLCYSVEVSALLKSLLSLGRENVLVQELRAAVTHPAVLEKVLHRFEDVRLLVSLYPESKDVIAEFVLTHIHTIVSSCVKDIRWIAEVLPEHANDLINALLTDVHGLALEDIDFLMDLQADYPLGSPRAEVPLRWMPSRSFFRGSFFAAVSKADPEVFANPTCSISKGHSLGC